MPSRIITIAGGTCSGKTRLALALQAALGFQNVTIIAMDSYYLPSDYSGRIGLGDVNFDDPALIDFSLLRRHVSELVAGGPVQIPVYQFKTHSRAGTISVTPTAIVVVEGVFALHDEELRRLSTLEVFLDVDSELRAVWRIRRDVEHNAVPIGEACEYYLRFTRPAFEEFVLCTKENAALVIEGPMDASDQVCAVIAALGDEV